MDGRAHKAADFTCPTTWSPWEGHKVYMAAAAADTELFTREGSIRANFTDPKCLRFLFFTSIRPLNISGGVARGEFPRAAPFCKQIATITMRENLQTSLIKRKVSPGLSGGESNVAFCLGEFISSPEPKFKLQPSDYLSCDLRTTSFFFFFFVKPLSSTVGSICCKLFIHFTISQCSAITLCLQYYNVLFSCSNLIF